MKHSIGLCLFFALPGITTGGRDEDYERLDEVDESCRYPCAEDILPDCGGDAARECGDHRGWLGGCIRYSGVGGSCINADEPCWYSGRGDVKQTTATLSNGQIDDKKQPPHLSGGSLFEC